MLGLSACAIGLLPACAEGPSDPAGSSAPSENGATFTVDLPGPIVAADGQAWMLVHGEGDVVLSRVDLTGRSTRVMRVPGRSPQLMPYREGVVLASVGCADEACEETVTEVLVLDGDGSTVSEQELSREPGPPDDGDGVVLLGVREDVFWVLTSTGLIAVEAQTGETVAQGPVPGGPTCLLADGVYALAPLSGVLGVADGEYTGDEAYEVAVRRLDDGSWTTLPDTRRTLSMSEAVQAECVAGTIRTGMADVASPAWSPATGWVQAEPYTAPVIQDASPLPVITVVAVGQADQRFALEGDGVLRRVFAEPGAPMSTETVELPAEVFAHDRSGPPPGLFLDMSSTVVAGCITQPFPGASAARCYIAPT